MPYLTIQTNRRENEQHENNGDKVMTYIIHQYDPYSDIWFTAKESPNLDDFDRRDKETFQHILQEGCEYVEEGNRMWTIDKEGN